MVKTTLRRSLSWLICLIPQSEEFRKSRRIGCCLDYLNVSHTRSLICTLSFLALVGPFSGCSSSGGDADPTNLPPPVADTQAPVITLQGENEQIVPFKSAYRDPGATAQDDNDGAVPVEVVGEVDTFVSGVYTLVYTAADSAGNSTELQRTVTVATEKVSLTLSFVGDGDFSIASGEVLNCDQGAGICTAVIDKGTTLQLNASPSVGFNFERWTNCDSVTGTMCEITLDFDTSVFATLTSEGPIVLHSSVIELTPEQVAGIANFSSDSNSLEFADSIDTSGFQIGSVLLAVGADDQVSPSFGRVVTSIETLPSGATRVLTRSAALVEVIAEGTFIATTLANAAAVTNGNSSSINQENIPQSKVGFGNAGLVLVNTDDLKITIEGSYDIEPDFELVVDIRRAPGDLLPTVRSWRLLSVFSLSGSFGPVFEGEIVEFEPLSAKLTLPPVVTVPIGTPIGPVQFEVSPVLEADAGFTAQVELMLQGSWQAITTGVQWTDTDGYSTISSSGERSFDVQGAESASGDVTLKLSVGGISSAELLGLAGPFIKAQAVTSVGVNLDPDVDCPIEVETYTGLAFSAGGQLSFLTYHADLELGPIEFGLSNDTPIACVQDAGVGMDGPVSADGLQVETGAYLGEIELSWTQAELDIQTFSVWRYAANSEAAPTSVAQTQVGAYTDRGLADATEYCYWVGDTGSSVPANDEFECASTLDVESYAAIAAPTLLPIVRAAETSLELEWTANDDLAQLEDFVVYDVSSPEMPLFVVATSDLLAQVNNLMAGETYCFAILAVASTDISGQFSNTECLTLTESPSSTPGIFPAIIELSSLESSSGITLNGAEEGDLTGRSVSYAGDINSDGLADIIIGAPQGTLSNAGFGIGKAYVLLGSTEEFSQSIELSELDGSSGFALVGIDSGDRAGWRVSSAGDVNGNGIDDVIIGAPRGGSFNSVGEAYVVFGRTTGFPASIDLSSLDGAAGFTFLGEDGNAGRAVGSAGDVNGDGFDDVLIGAPLDTSNGNFRAGAVYVIYGQSGAWPSSLEVSDLNGQNGAVLFGGAGIFGNGSDTAGFVVNGVGDINADGFDDVAIGAPEENFSDVTGSRGVTYVLFGADAGLPHEIVLSDEEGTNLDGTNGFEIPGLNGTSMGYGADGIGDINNDGIDDLVVTAYLASPGGRARAGEAYVIYGRNTQFPAVVDVESLDGETGFTMGGVTPNDRLGLYVSGAGDVNADGIDDLIVGITNANRILVGNTSAATGESAVLFGNSMGFPGVFDLEDLNGSNGFLIRGIDPGDFIGFVSGAGDINGDGVDDIAVGGSGGDPNGLEDAGEVFIIFGRSGD